MIRVDGSTQSSLNSYILNCISIYLDGLALGANREGGHLLWGGKVAQDEGAEDGREGAPVANNVT
jgi:hypothetical protein